MLSLEKEKQMEKGAVKPDRQIWADYAKGICILLVYIGHLNILPRPIRIFIYLFHMPVFFFCMGFYSKNISDIKGYLLKRFMHLMVPYYIICVYYIVLLPLIEGSLNLSEIPSDFSMMFLQVGSASFLNHTWFLPAAYICSVFFAFFRKYINNEKLEVVLVVFIAACFVYLHKYTGLALPLYIDVAFPCIVFMYLGHIVHEKHLEISLPYNILLFFIGIMISAVITAIYVGSDEKYVLDYHTLKLTPYLLVLIGGGVMCISIYGLLKKVKRGSVLTYIGEFSLVYYLFDRIVADIIKTLLKKAEISSPVVIALLGLAGIIIFVPLIVEFIRRYCWFLFGLKRKKRL